MIKEFIENLRTEERRPNVLNQYGSDWEFREIACNNLEIYLKQMLEVNSRVLFVGEAPGYRGCKLSGIPFTSEKLLLSNGIESSIINYGNGYLVRNPEKPQAEASATIMWEAFNKYGFYPLLWNAFPFHPFKADQPLSNRKPNIEELEIGIKYINKLISIYEIEEVYAVGNVAHETLGRMGYSVEKIRHPSKGGKAEFINGIMRIIHKK